MSYSDESYRRDPVRTGGGFFRPPPPPAPTTPPPASKPVTKRAAQVAPPTSVKIVRPTGRINLVVAFDVTSSMGADRENIRDKIDYFVNDIRQVLPDLVGDMEIAFAGVGDHCDGRQMLQFTPFSSDVHVLKNNIASIVGTHGGDAPEGYECFFQKMNTWDIDGTNTVLIMIGDSVPHGIGLDGDNGCPDGVNWGEELSALKKKLKAFYFISCTEYTKVKRLQRLMADDQDHFVEIGNDLQQRITNVVHAIIAEEVGKLDKYMAHLAATRGQARATEVATLLKTKS